MNNKLRNWNNTVWLARENEVDVYLHTQRTYVLTVERTQRVGVP